MAKNFNSIGVNVDFELGNAPTPESGAVKSGDPVMIGSIWGVALEDEIVRDGKRVVTVATEGVYLFEMTSIPAFGTEVFLVDGSIVTTPAKSTNPPFGICVGSAIDSNNKPAARIRIQQVSAANATE